MKTDLYRDCLNIDRSRGPVTLYHLLGLPLFARDPVRIRKAYEDVSGKVHQWEGGKYADSITELLEELTHAYLCLSDPAKKRAYDQQLRSQMTRRGEQAATETKHEEPAPAGSFPAPDELPDLPEPDSASVLLPPMQRDYEPQAAAVALPVWLRPALIGALAGVLGLGLVVGGLVWFLGGDEKELATAPLVPPPAAFNPTSPPDAADGPSAGTADPAPAEQSKTTTTVAPPPDSAATEPTGSPLGPDTMLPPDPASSPPIASTEPPGLFPPGVSRPLSIPEGAAEPASADGTGAVQPAGGFPSPAGLPLDGVMPGADVPSHAPDGVPAEDAGMEPESEPKADPDAAAPTDDVPAGAGEVRNAELDPIIAEAQQLVQGSQADQAKARLLAALRTAGGDRRPEFYLGLLTALVEREPLKARKYFSTCVRAWPEHVPALNNLAICEVRAGEYTDAIQHWQRALQFQPDATAPVDNLAYAAQLIGFRGIRLPPTVRATLTRLASGATSANAWHYLDFTDATSAGAPATWLDLTDSTCMVCNGVGHVRCSNPHCKRGRVSVSGTVPLGRTAAGTVIGKQTITGPCGACGGLGRLPCPACQR